MLSGEADWPKREDLKIPTPRVPHGEAQVVKPHGLRAHITATSKREIKLLRENSYHVGRETPKQAAVI